jgi:hypothetical protein
MTDKTFTDNDGSKFTVTEKDLERELPDKEYQFVKMCVDDDIIEKPRMDSRNSITNKYHISCDFPMKVIEEYKHLIPKFCKELDSLWHEKVKDEKLRPAEFACLIRLSLLELIGQWASINRVHDMHTFQKENV